MLLVLEPPIVTAPGTPAFYISHRFHVGAGRLLAAAGRLRTPFKKGLLRRRASSSRRRCCCQYARSFSVVAALPSLAPRERRGPGLSIMSFGELVAPAGTLPVAGVSGKGVGIAAAASPPLPSPRPILSPPSKGGKSLRTIRIRRQGTSRCHAID